MAFTPPSWYASYFRSRVLIVLLHPLKQSYKWSSNDFNTCSININNNGSIFLQWTTFWHCWSSVDIVGYLIFIKTFICRQHNPPYIKYLSSMDNQEMHSEHLWCPPSLSNGNTVVSANSPPQTCSVTRFTIIYFNQTRAHGEWLNLMWCVG